MFKPYAEMNEAEKVEMAIFLLECKDCWNSADYDEYHALSEKLRALKGAN